MSVALGSFNNPLPSYNQVTSNGGNDASGPSPTSSSSSPSHMASAMLDAVTQQQSRSLISGTDQQKSEQHGRDEDGGVGKLDQCAKAEDAAAEFEDGHYEEGKRSFVLSPPIPLKAQIDKDKDDESLRKWKEKLLGCIQLDGIEEGVEPELKVLGLSIESEGRPSLVVDLHHTNNPKTRLFTLKEGTPYALKFTFSLRRNIVSGLTYVHTIWKSGIRVDRSRVMLGTFAPQEEPHVVLMEEEVTPSGIFARGNYTAKTKFIDDDGRCHFEMEHTFDIRKEW